MKYIGFHVQGAHIVFHLKFIPNGQPDISALYRMPGGIIFSGCGADAWIKGIVVIQKVPD
jgi:hypothetical protein